MTWIYLIVAGLLEVFWASTMKLSNGFTDLKYTILTIIGMILSFVGLSLAMKELPLGIAYPIWTGVGIVGTIIMGIVFFGDIFSIATWIFVAMLVIGIIGIKLTTGH